MTRVYVPVGLGSGICGMVAARDALGLQTEIIGVVSSHAPTYQLSFEHGGPVPTNSADTLADGLAVRTPDPAALDVMLAGVSRIVAVDDDAVLRAVGYYLVDTHNLAEGAGAAPLAAALQDRAINRDLRIGLVLSGGNISRTVLGAALGLDAP